MFIFNCNNIISLKDILDTSLTKGWELKVKQLEYPYPRICVDFILNNKILHSEQYYIRDIIKESLRYKSPDKYLVVKIYEKLEELVLNLPV